MAARTDGIDFPILYVDDDPDNLIVFEASFAPELEILTARSAEAALETLEHRKVAVLITDQRMPGMTGVELCERVRLRHPHVRRILLTAYGDLPTAIEAINRGGVQAFLSKPWHKDEVRRAIEAQLEPLRLEREVSALRVALTRREAETGLPPAHRKLLHDFGTVLQRIQLGGRKLERQLGESVPPENPARDTLRQLMRAVEHLAELHFRMGAAGTRRESPRPTALPIRALIDEVRELTGTERRSRIRFHVRAPEGLKVWADRLELVRILVNLVTNAEEAIAAASIQDGEITLSARASGEEVEIDVEDNGPGIAPEDRERLLEGFTTKAETGGSGLGLASARELAERNGGTLLLAPSHTRGASFCLRLPGRPPSHEAPE